MGDEKTGLMKSVYDDLLSPTIKQMGNHGSQLYKILSIPINMVLLPLASLSDILAPKLENIFNFLNSSIKENDIVEQGHNQLLIPCLQNLLLYQDKESKLEQIWLNLLATSLDKTKQEYAHPAFPILLAQLSYDEIMMLALLTKNSYPVEQFSEFDRTKNIFYNEKTITDQFPIDKLINKDMLWFYNDHLHSLNLSGCWHTKNQEPKFNEKGVQNGVQIFSEFRISKLGTMLSHACDFEEMLK